MITRKQKREFNKVISIQEKLYRKSEELIELSLYERRDIWDMSESPQIRTEQKKRARLEQEYEEISNELLTALEDYGWRN